MWRKWLYFEFWPAWFFYIPIVPYYIYLSLRYKSFIVPFYANPNILNGGLIGESKWDFLKHLNPTDSSTLAALRISKHNNLSETQELLKKENFFYPLVIKPDVGQRRFGVRIIKSDAELAEYLKLSNFDRIVQKWSKLPAEAGLFYIRKPHEQTGQIFSITDKKFPFVKGDGQTQLGDLILADKRARIIALTYFSRLKDKLNTIPLKDEIIFLSECGNHCQGAIFEDGNGLKTEALRLECDRIAKQIPHFYFGRFDVRYRNYNLLKLGKDFEIVEVNGAGAEATHIWDKKTKLIDAYQTLFKQWEILFFIGYECKKLYPKNNNIQVRLFLKESLKIALRKEKLSVSS